MNPEQEVMAIQFFQFCCVPYLFMSGLTAFIVGFVMWARDHYKGEKKYETNVVEHSRLVASIVMQARTGP